MGDRDTRDRLQTGTVAVDHLPGDNGRQTGMMRPDLSAGIQETPPRSMLKTLLLIVVVVVLLAGGMVLMQSRQQHVSGPAATEPGKQAAGPAVQVLTPQRRDLVRSLTLPANIAPWFQATLYGKVSGYVKWLGVDKGDKVTKGQLLAVLDAPEIEDQYKQADADYTIKKLTAERLLNVWKENPDVIAKQDVDVAQAAAQAAKHLRDSRRTLLDYTKVYAPFSGVITARFVDPGALIQAATGSSTQAAPVYTIMDLDTLRIYVSVPQEAAFLAKPGIPAVLVAKEVPGKEFRATLTRTTQSLDPATRTLLAEIDLPNKDRMLQPGMFISATLTLEQHRNALAIPPAAVVTEKTADQKSVFVVQQGTVHRVPITTGLDDGVWIEVTSGLQGHEDVVVVGKSGLTDGQTVSVSTYNLPTAKPANQKM